MIICNTKNFIFISHHTSNPIYDSNHPFILKNSCQYYCQRCRRSLAWECVKLIMKYVGMVKLFICTILNNNKWRKRPSPSSKSTRDRLDGLGKTRREGTFSAAAARDTSHIPHSTPMSKQSTAGCSRAALKRRA